MDDLERESRIAIMREKARRLKEPSAKDLFNRENVGTSAEELEKHVERAEHAREWLSQFDFSGEEDDSG